VSVCEAKPSLARKFLMAGKSGLNLTKDEAFEPLLRHYFEAAEPLAPILRAFDSQAVQTWARDLGEPIFTGSTGRVFPVAMKASPLLRAWLAQLRSMGVRFETRCRGLGWRGAELRFEGAADRRADVVVLALGGGSWARLGSDGSWQDILRQAGAPVAPFQPANAGLRVQWSPYMQAHLGAALKNVRLSAENRSTRAETVLSRAGLEGGGIYELSRDLRRAERLRVDLLPDRSIEQIVQSVRRAGRKMSIAGVLRKALRLDPVKIALAQEFAHPLPKEPLALARQLKNLEIRYEGLAPLDQAISTAGGVRFDGLTEDLMLHCRAGVFCAGEMLDWEAPTGGYLLTACLATGRWAGRGAARYLGLVPVGSGV
jgi:uncharacterized flavoprotein (TIGR03862 family)